MKNVNWKDVAVRAAKTFIETAVAAFLAGINGVDLFTQGEGFWLALALSAASAGVSAVWNGMIEPVVRQMIGKSEG